MEDKVTAVPVSGTEQPFEISICVDNQKWTDGYIGTMVNMVTEKKEEELTEILYEFGSITPTNLSNILPNDSQLSVAGRYEFEVTDFSSNELVWGTNLDVKEGMVLLGPIEAEKGDVVEALLIENRKQTPEEVGICLSEDLWRASYKEHMIKTFGFNHKSVAEELINKIRDQILLERTSGTSNTKSDADTVEDSTNSEKKGRVGPQPDESDPDLDSLQKEAEEDEMEDVPEYTTTDRHSTKEYTRSKKIKKYVKKRADGLCEGCGERAPFTSKTGKPYFHAHHVHELSDGGSDTIDTVIALCPNCHYRVHHGQGGEEYNQQLIEKLQELEGN
jgi:hypothetical protein